jgi:hypothetical protein
MLELKEVYAIKALYEEREEAMETIRTDAEGKVNLIFECEDALVFVWIRSHKASKGFPSLSDQEKDEMRPYFEHFLIGFLDSDIPSTEIRVDLVDMVPTCDGSVFVRIYKDWLGS